MSVFVTLSEVQKQATNIDNIFTEINKLWDEIYLKHREEVNHIIDVAHNVHTAFYNYLKEVYTICNSSSTYFESVEEEMQIAKNKKRFDSNTTTEIARSTQIILDALIENKHRSSAIFEDMNACEKLIVEAKKEQKTHLDKLSRMKNFLRSLSAATASGIASAGAIKIALGDSAANNGSALKGSVAIALVCGSFATYLQVIQKKKFLKLHHAMLDMFNWMIMLQEESFTFGEKMELLVTDVKRYIVRVEKIIRCSSITEDDSNRVVILATDMISASDTLKSRFDQMGQEAIYKRSSLKNLIQMHDPRAILEE
ncbi:uncharacterized protein EV154DRAFT_488187 [Mucor mucedo]|uniref:uncharacterized protein n=1 Tax=Mucor mucedo TaxID=29922 RepID=UPI00221EF849|nr:uncharacterized protein EV154DRAFT_488187 [Mucor mucedo]KAI7868210.1 hypothetical protein EV154DRAFT_488187 [Mucor mucedo]